MSSSPGKPVKANIFAAGAVLWRKSPDNPDEIEIALIHRPKYEDWSFPKGKLDPGETAVVAALREVEEETGIRGRLGRHLGALTYPIPGHRRLKRVEYWAAEARAGEFVPNSEVDEMRWLPVSEVADQLSYPMDRKMLRRFTAQPPDTATVLLVRHAKAGSRKRYKGDDTTRPLDANGLLQAEALVTQLEAFGATDITSADRTRCTQTVEPLARTLDTTVRLDPLLSEESYTADPVATRTLVRKIASLGGVQVICSQGGVIPDLLDWWAEIDGIALPPARNRKASTWVLSLSGGKLIAADHIDSPLPPTRKD
ncbi:MULTISPECIES: NUDIX hydrolase [Rhodococcus]|uniref:NTP pyrophosphohydrolase MutT n=2 Tax=Rhodococcus TaxID=1827 RepID=X0QIG0_RHOWR|nr:MULTISPECIES: bifunctional NUDIX hydrolase/histidine phosphatase family protein [Rhodococcus]AII04538.1 NUDIX hydrolase [Rhodococcus opacus]WAM15814.1 bifunctional NUDIX hydrolase/histidine phosphatase family protein [Rhodococcus sp. JS3073]GAF51332.1 NTP pyrophosphohydrolase MutT [Rhodococcus wratislaviensis NBRC 100605]